MDGYKEALSWAAAYCSRSEHCRSEVIEHLERYELSAEEQSRLLKRLEEEGYLDELRYARAFVSDQFRFHQWGRLKIRQGLQLRKISDAVIGEAMTVISESDYVETLTRLLQAKMKHISAGNTYEMAAKLMRFAYGKGYEIETVRKCIDISELAST